MPSSIFYMFLILLFVESFSDVSAMSSKDRCETAKEKSLRFRRSLPKFKIITNWLPISQNISLLTYKPNQNEATLCIWMPACLHFRFLTRGKFSSMSCFCLRDGFVFILANASNLIKLPLGEMAWIYFVYEHAKHAFISKFHPAHALQLL